MLLFVMLLLNSVFSPIQQARYIDVSISTFQKTFENLQFAWCFLSFYGDVMYQLNRSFNSPSPFHRGHTLGIWHLCCTGEEGIWLSESSKGVGNLNHSLDFMWNLWALCTSYHGRRSVRGFLCKRLCLWGQLVTRKELKQAFCLI